MLAVWSSEQGRTPRGSTGLPDLLALSASQGCSEDQGEKLQEIGEENLQGRSFVFLSQTVLRSGTRTCWVKIVKKSYVNIYIKNI